MGRVRMGRRGRLALLLSALLPLIVACSAYSPASTPVTTTAGAAQAMAQATTVAQAATVPAAETAAASTAVVTTVETTTVATAATATTAATMIEATATATVTAAPPTPTASPTATTAPTPTVAPPTPTVTPRPAWQGRVPYTPAFGVVAHLYYTNRAAVLGLAQSGGFEWVRQQVPWKDSETQGRTLAVDELDKIVGSVRASGRKLLLSLVKSPDFLTGRKDDNGLPKNPQDFGRFAELIARRYKGQVQAIEVWNEQNLAVENGGRVVPEDAGRYVELLKAAYTRIKAVDPSIVVVAGALSSTGVNQPDIAVDDLTYLQAMYAYRGGEIRNYFDVQGFHPASTLNPPDKKFPDDPGPRPAGCTGGCWGNAPTHYFRHIEDVRQVMFNSGLGDKKIWITEMGWATKNNTPGYEYGNFVSLQQQADYFQGALDRIVNQYGDWVGAVFIWNLNFAPLWAAQGNPLEEQASFGLLNPDWSPRPAFVRVQRFISSVKRR